MFFYVKQTFLRFYNFSDESWTENGKELKKRTKNISFSERACDCVSFGAVTAN